MDVAKIQDFMELAGHLKHLPRTGWVLEDIPFPESVAGHMYRMAIMTFLIDEKDNLDKFKVMQMALIHDLAECVVGDITPRCGVPVEEKHRREDNAMVDISQLLGDKGPDMLQLFREYESGESAEAKYVKDLDRLDLISQAYEYEKRDNIPGKLDEFFDNSVDKIQHPHLKKLADEIMRRRDKVIQNKTAEKE
ncbi:hypothetical protein PV326_000854 [Microctonus aethiopoides]|uniref:5'-deoxynucleotidase HDDC2 n=1 Tax=Microctonus aethiopoides TaxID=144406 RepID=A0AA39C4P0_9HYME|nr:hypothetical protein PV326_000854 [Microctonus aethiopoides]KAK0157870.1 hypothetical protein PV328_011559 [Microctonus aethiopoides]